MASIFKDSIRLSKHDSGVYAIINRISHKIYIGSTVDMANRRRGHRFDLTNNKHGSIRLQGDFNKYGDVFEFVIIEIIPSKNVHLRLSREQFWMNFYKSYLPEMGYNMCPDSRSSIGVIRRESTKRALSKSHNGPRLNRRRPIIQCDLNGVELAMFDSSTTALKSLPRNASKGNIVSVMRGTQKTAYGFKWKYAHS